MNTTTIASLLMGASLPVVAETITFDQDAVGSLPSGWMAGVTGRGAPHWAVETDPTVPSGPNVLKHSGAGTFPWCVKKGTALTDGVVEVKFKPTSGNEDQDGGLVWRWKDGDTTTSRGPMRWRTTFRCITPRMDAGTRSSMSMPR